MKKTLDLIEKIVRQLDPQIRENLAGDIVAVKQKVVATNDELETLAKCVGNAALKAGIYNGQVALTGAHLIQLLDDMATSLAPKAQVESGVLEAAQVASQELDDALLADVQTKVAQAGELLIRAAAVLGTLPAAEQERLHAATEGNLTDCLAWALQGAAKVSPAVANSLKTHPPVGFNAMHRR